MTETYPDPQEIHVIRTKEEPPPSPAQEDATSLSLIRKLPQSLPNGLSLPPRYRTLLSYFSGDILASLSCHPSIHDDLCRGLIPVALDSPHLLSACLALSAAGFQSRGVNFVDGINVSRVLGHLQSSGLSLLRSALGNGQMNETMLATCLIWCLADVFACKPGTSSWRVHLQGIKALIEGNQGFRSFGSGAGQVRMAMRHLHQLYLSLQTLPYVPSVDVPEEIATNTRSVVDMPVLQPSIDGFLGYSEELLHILQQINQISGLIDINESLSVSKADFLLGKVKGMIRRDSRAPPSISISASLSSEHDREFSLCHKTFQQATLIHLYRKLYRMPSGSVWIQAAIDEIEGMLNEMTQGEPCHTWVAMAMPLFTIGCEAYTAKRRSFVLDKVDKLDACLGSLHVRIIRQALQDIWQARDALGDEHGELCASPLLGKRILFEMCI